jgi:hypothetical protein
MTPEERLDRAEQILVRIAKIGREARSEFRQKLNILINAQIRNEAAWRAESHALDEKINILIQSQLATNEQIRSNSEQIKNTNEQFQDLAVSQAQLAKSQKLTDQALRAFINSLRKGQNGKS